MKRIVFSVFLSWSLLCSALLTGCLSTKSTKSADNKQTTKKTTSARAQPSPLAAFSEHTLSNNIPLIVKKHSGTFISIRFVIEGGVSLLKETYSGLENVTLQLMLTESANFSQEATAELEKNHDFSITAASKKDYSYIELVCAEKDFDVAFNVFADRILHPTLREKAFNALMEEKKAAIAQKAATPQAMLSNELRSAAYKHHPYATSPLVTQLSADKITFDAVKQYHKKILGAEKVKIIAVGNFSGGTDGTGAEKNTDSATDGEHDSEAAISIDSIVAKTEDAFGAKSPIAPLNITIPSIPPLDFSQHKNLSQKESALFGEECYAVSYFNAPHRFDADYVPYVFAGMILDDLLFDEVKQKDSAQSAVKSLGVGIMEGMEQTGIISVFKAKTSEGLIDSIDEAIASFPKEKVIRRELNRYKKDYIMALYEKNREISGVADSVMTSYVYARNPAKYLERPDRVETVTAKQIFEAYQKYFSQKDGRKWIVLTGKISAETENQ